MKFCDRTAAGRQLAAALQDYAHDPNAVVLALPRGGVPVAAEVARALGLPLDICLVRKLGVPGQRELAMGAIAPSGTRVINTDLVLRLDISPTAIDRVTRRELRELRRRQQRYRGERPPVEICDRTVILIDDGIATGATMRAALSLLRQRHPRQLVVAVPVGPADTCAALSRLADRVVCPLQPEPFQAIGLWYEDFRQTSDEEVCRLLALPTPP